jgi:hypothetical protein
MYHPNIIFSAMRAQHSCGRRNCHRGCGGLTAGQAASHSGWAGRHCKHLQTRVAEGYSVSICANSCMAFTACRSRNQHAPRCHVTEQCMLCVKPPHPEPGVGKRDQMLPQRVKHSSKPHMGAAKLMASNTCKHNSGDLGLPGQRQHCPCLATVDTQLSITL